MLQDIGLIILLILCYSCWIIMYPWLREEISTCHCEYSLVKSNNSPYDKLVCRNATTAEAVLCVDKFLTSIVNKNNLNDLQVEIGYSDLEVFGDKILDKSSRLTSLRLSSCSVKEIPQRLIGRLAPQLTTLRLDSNDINRLQADELVHWRNLQILDLSVNKISKVSPKAFRGLVKLQELHLEYNAIDRLSEWEGLENLRILDLTGNNIKKVNSNAFERMAKLTTLNLAENQIMNLDEGTFDPIRPQILILALNPLNCTCSLKWLQNWIIDNDVGNDAFCAGPEMGNLTALNICPADDLANTTWPAWLSAFLQLGSVLGIIFIILYAAYNSNIIHSRKTELVVTSFPS